MKSCVTPVLSFPSSSLSLSLHISNDRRVHCKRNPLFQKTCSNLCIKLFSPFLERNSPCRKTSFPRLPPLRALFTPYTRVARLLQSSTRLLVTRERGMTERAQDVVIQWLSHDGECGSAYRIRRYCDDASGGDRDNDAPRLFSRKIIAHVINCCASTIMTYKALIQRSGELGCKELSSINSRNHTQVLLLQTCTHTQELVCLARIFPIFALLYIILFTLIGNDFFIYYL